MILRIDAESPDDRRLQQVVDCLRKGGVIVYPTDTVYTLGCDVSHRKAYERVCRLKNVRPKKANFSLVCNDLSHLSSYALGVSTPMFKYMKRCLPGPYTFILQANKEVQKIFGYRKREVGIRIPDHAIPVGIVERLGQPILSASVRDDTIEEYVTDPEELAYTLGDKVDMVIDAGPCGLEPSTIIDYTEGEPVLVRQGKGEI